MGVDATLVFEYEPEAKIYIQQNEDIYYYPFKIEEKDDNVIVFNKESQIVFLKDTYKIISELIEVKMKEPSGIESTEKLLINDEVAVEFDDKDFDSAGSEEDFTELQAEE